MSPIRVGSQCAGYGGIEMALQQHLNVEHAWYAEVDEAASKVLAHHFPGVPNYGDITEFDWTTAELVSIFTSGFPCQGFSQAGKRLGSADDRHLWPTGVLPALRALMPPLAVFENVPGLLTIEHGQVFAQILADLDELGYTVSWTTVGACKVGACHHRHRVFIAATLVDTPAPKSDPVAHRSPVRRLGGGPLAGGWAPAQAVLFGDSEAVRWPAAGRPLRQSCSATRRRSAGRRLGSARRALRGSCRRMCVASTSPCSRPRPLGTPLVAPGGATSPVARCPR